MFAFMIVLHLVVCLSLVTVVLMQSGKGGGLAGGAFLRFVRGRRS